MSRRSYMHTVDAHSLSNRQKLACLCGFSGGGPSQERPFTQEGPSEQRPVHKRSEFVKSTFAKHKGSSMKFIRRFVDRECPFRRSCRGDVHRIGTFTLCTKHARKVVARYFAGD